MTKFLKFYLLCGMGFFTIQQQIHALPFSGNQISPKGAFCWFADPRALHYENAGGTINATYIGYIDVHGNIKATQHDFITGKSSEVLIRSYFQPDDHNNPSFIVLPDERVMIFYSRHTDEACFYYRISRKPGDINTLGDEKKIITANNTTYPSPFILSDDPNHIYLCWRGINWHPTIARLTMPDAQDNTSFNWGPYQMVQSTGARPYAKYFSNGKDKIYLSYTTGHPDNEYPNYLYFNYVDVNTKQLKDINGTTLSTIASGVHNVNKTTYPTSYPNAVVDMPVDQRDWLWQTSADKLGNPVVAMVQISNDKNTHNYYYAKWTGTSWRKTFLANGGGKFHQTAGLELCYSGGMAIDENDPNVVYCSVPVTGNSGTIYELKKFILSDEGIVLSSEMITNNSVLNNARPYPVTNSGKSPLKLVWMHGNYYDWIVSSTRPQGYPTAIHSDWALPLENSGLNDGLTIHEQFAGAINGNASVKNGFLITTPATEAVIAQNVSSVFSVSLTPYLYAGAYGGDVIQIGNLSWGVNASTLKPYVKIAGQTWNSQNVFGTSDVWQTQSRGTGGIWYTPTKLNFFNLTITKNNDKITIYRNGLIDQVIETNQWVNGRVKVGGFSGWTKDCRVYDRELNQTEVKTLSAASVAQTLPAGMTAELELASLNVPAEIYTDVVLPATTASGVALTWSSSNTAVVSNAGIVTLPATATNVEISVTASGQTKTFQTVVMPRDIQKNRQAVYTFGEDELFVIDGQKYVKDKSGKNRDAFIYGNATINGKLDLTANTATGFSGNGYARVPQGLLSNLRSYTFLVKVKPTSLTSQPRIFDFGSASANSILLRASALTGGLKFNGASTILVNATQNLTAGVDANVAMSFDAKTKTTKIYLNGAETASATTITQEPWQLTTIGTDSRNYIGRTQWWDSSVAAQNVDFAGTIDNVYLFDIALTPTEIALVQSDSYAGMSKTFFDETCKLSPNPVYAGSMVKIQTHYFENTHDTKISIHHVSGKIIREISSFNGDFSFKSPDTAGMYFITISDQDKRISMKLSVI